jgi:putative glutathione S-transferase
MLNLAFGNPQSDLNLYPESLRLSIDQMNRQISQQINLGVYRVGTATTQSNYEAALTELFTALATIDSLLEHQLFLLGDQITESDLLLFTTAVRFDIAYYPVLYTSLKHWADFSNLFKHMQRLMKVDAIARTVKPEQYLRHYFDDDTFINRYQLPDGHFIVPVVS